MRQRTMSGHHDRRLARCGVARGLRLEACEPRLLLAGDVAAYTFDLDFESTPLLVAQAPLSTEGDDLVSLTSFLRLNAESYASDGVVRGSFDRIDDYFPFNEAADRYQLATPDLEVGWADATDAGTAVTNSYSGPIAIVKFVPAEPIVPLPIVGLKPPPLASKPEATTATGPVEELAARRLPPTGETLGPTPAAKIDPTGELTKANEVADAPETSPDSQEDGLHEASQLVSLARVLNGNGSRVDHGSQIDSQAEAAWAGFAGGLGSGDSPVASSDEPTGASQASNPTSDADPDGLWVLDFAFADHEGDAAPAAPTRVPSPTPSEGVTPGGSPEDNSIEPTVALRTPNTDASRTRSEARPLQSDRSWLATDAAGYPLAISAILAAVVTRVWSRDPLGRTERPDSVTPRSRSGLRG